MFMLTCALFISKEVATELPPLLVKKLMLIFPLKQIEVSISAVTNVKQFYLLFWIDEALEGGTSIPYPFNYFEQ